jgi:hypothetical protein
MGKKMYTFSLRWLSLALILWVARIAYSQNIDTNPNFDTGLEGWATFGTVEWAPSFGVETGSMHLASSSSASYAMQCLSAEGGAAFVASARVYAHCPGMRFYVFWSATSDCSDTGAFPSYFAVSEKSDTWEPLTVTAPARDDVYKIELMLFNGGGCTNGAYFDDVIVQYDQIFNDGFDLRGID